MSLNLVRFDLLEVIIFQITCRRRNTNCCNCTDVIPQFCSYQVLELKLDAIPGRLNQFELKSRVPEFIMVNVLELCGVGHGFMAD